MTTPNSIIDVQQDDDTLEAKWEELFKEVLDNRNLSVKDVETAKFVFFKGGEAFFNIMNSAPLSRIATLRDEIAEYLGDGEDSDLWVPVTADQKGQDAKTDSKQG